MIGRNHRKENLFVNLLIVEDEVQLADALAEILQRNKYHVDTVYNGEDGLHYASTGIYDCIILDIMLPILDGISVLRALRKQKVSTPVLLLTAKSDVADSGADDYLTKPFVTGELLARIRAMTRRTGEVTVDGLQFHSLHLDTCNYTLSCGQENIKLSLKEYQIMEVFMSNPHQIISKECFIEKIWGYESDVEYNNIEVYISFLRKKLQSIHANVSIKTARGIGYFLEEQKA
jgi:DNA-binding response OmpR family regulator